MEREGAREEGREQGPGEGRKEGNEQGQDQLSSMPSWLIASGRNDDVTRAVNDKATRNELYKEYSQAASDK